MLYSYGVTAEIIKCVDESGTIKYQEKECDNKDKSSKIELKNVGSNGLSKNDRIKIFIKDEPPTNTLIPI